MSTNGTNGANGNGHSNGDGKKHQPLNYWFAPIPCFARNDTLPLLTFKLSVDRLDFG